MKINKSLLALAAASVALTMLPFRLRMMNRLKGCFISVGLGDGGNLGGLEVPMRTVSSWLPMRGLGIAAGMPI